ncbi:hypothetical protein [Streptomyces sp. NPDC048527]|uniref:hypothetical protein n=1 Tax=Streptomyces sp. NPDC048527 TaxID=3365568 RepID=UPI0037166EE5
MKWRSAAVTAVWAAGATAVGGLGAWSLAGIDGTDHPGRPLDDAAVHRALSHASANSPMPSGPSSSTSSGQPSARRDTVRFPGGTATVECRPGGLVYLVSWSPDDGYHVDEFARGPAAVASIELERSDDDADEPDNDADTDEPDDPDDAAYEFRCAHGEPEAGPALDDDQ